MDIIGYVGYIELFINGSDEEKIVFLKSKVNEDLQKAIRMEIPDNFKIKINGNILKGIDFHSY